jgi:amidohydrolase
VTSLLSLAQTWTDAHTDQLVGWRRDLHAHPEIAFAERRTTEMIFAQLSGFGLSPRRMALGTGVVCDIGTAAAGAGRIALRADIDALPLPDAKSVPYASRHPGVCHACGHDAHTTILLGVAAVLGSAAGRADVRMPPIRLIFQPAEERMPGGAVAAVTEGVLDGVSAIFALHCDPRLDVGLVGLRTGPITAAFNQVEITLKGAGGHTARPHLTVDIVYALGKLITELPGLLSRRIDPRSALSLVWGAVAAGSTPNAIPTSGTLRGTLRMLDADLWSELEPTVRELVASIVEPTVAELEVSYDRGLPAVDNDGALVTAQTQAAIAALGRESVSDTAQSMGGEDFAWYLQTVPGAMARLGVRTPGTEGGDLHQAAFDIDEAALPIGVLFTAALVDEMGW